MPKSLCEGWFKNNPCDDPAAVEAVCCENNPDFWLADWENNPPDDWLAELENNPVFWLVDWENNPVFWLVDWENNPPDFWLVDWENNPEFWLADCENNPPEFCLACCWPKMLWFEDVCEKIPPCPAEKEDYCIPPEYLSHTNQIEEQMIFSRE